MATALRFWRDASLGAKLIGFTSLLVIGVALALTAVSFQREQSTFRVQLEDQADLLLDALTLNMRDPLYKLQVDELDDTVGAVDDEEAITLLIIYDRNGAVLIDSKQSVPVYSTRVEPLGEKLIREGKRGETIYEWQTGQLVAGRVVTIGNQKVGAVAIGLSTAPLDEKLTALSLQSALVAALMIGVGVGLTFLLTRTITRPLEGLTQAAVQMAEGKLEARVEPRSKDEVGQLAAAFNQMADRVKQRETDLKDLAAGLDQMVKQRTSQLEEQNQALTRARQQAEEATQIKSQFLATISHELRTPLNSIMGFSQLLLMGAAGDLNETQAERMERILKSGQELLILINDLLDLSKIEAGRAEIIHKPFAVRAWALEVGKQLETLAHRKKLDFETSVDKAMPDTIVGDPDRLRQVAVNLIGNAIKFTEKGKVSLKIEKFSDQMWAIVVKDTGIGIPSHAQEFIFDEFRQLDSSPQREYGGTGLGLSIVRNLTVMMGGTVRVQSKVGEGSVFTIQLPLALEPAKEKAPKR